MAASSRLATGRMPEAAAVKTESTSLLPHQSINADAGKETILFIHGACSTGQEWDLVLERLLHDSGERFHVLLPDLPGHGESRFFNRRAADSERSGDQTCPIFSVDSSTLHLSNLIKARAKNGKAHIVGLSLGARIGLDLAVYYPAWVETVILSGFGIFPIHNAAVSAAAPYVFWGMQKFESALPRKWISWAMDGAQLRRSEAKNSTLELCKAIVGTISTTDTASAGESSPPDRSTPGSGPSRNDSANLGSVGGKKEPNGEMHPAWPRSAWPARTLIVAAGKGSALIPSADSTEDAARLAEIGQPGNPQTCAVGHPLMRHPWTRQDPQLFAKMVLQWIERVDEFDEWATASGFKKTTRRNLPDTQVHIWMY